VTTSSGHPGAGTPHPLPVPAGLPPAAPPPAGGNELRRDPFTGRWTVIAAGRGARPSSFHRTARRPRGPLGCPFCGGNEHLTPPEIWADRAPGTPPDTPGWRIRVVPNKFAAFSGGATGAPVRDGRMPAAGAHEVIVHGPEHRTGLLDLEPGTLAAAVGAWRRRLAHHAAGPLGSVVVIVNDGREAGASLEHSHAQVFATALRPELVQAEVDRLACGSCAACELVAGERAGGVRLVRDADGLVTTCPWASLLPFESLLLPGRHSPRLEADPATGDQALAAGVADALARLRAAVGHHPPVNLVVHSAPPGVADFHWHLHVLPRLATLGGFELGTGVLINVVDPDHAAARLRAAARKAPPLSDR